MKAIDVRECWVLVYDNGTVYAGSALLGRCGHFFDCESDAEEGARRLAHLNMKPLKLFPKETERAA